MSLWGSIGTFAALLAMVAFVVYAARRGAEMEREWKARVSRARRSVATVLSTRRGSSAIRHGGHHAPEIILQLRVEGHVVTTRWHVFELGLARIVDGARVSVRVDADDPGVVYPADDWAELSFSQRLALVTFSRAATTRP
ncbi:MAG: hypothetical protein K0S65_1304 [Labilithrix sp.]|nr:hypothetical protein [Labilithrix sp.]